MLSAGGLLRPIQRHPDALLLAAAERIQLAVGRGTGQGRHACGNEMINLRMRTLMKPQIEEERLPLPRRPTPVLPRTHLGLPHLLLLGRGVLVRPEHLVVATHEVSVTMRCASTPPSQDCMFLFLTSSDSS